MRSCVGAERRVMDAAVAGAVRATAPQTATGANPPHGCRGGASWRGSRCHTSPLLRRTPVPTPLATCRPLTRCRPGRSAWSGPAPSCASPHPSSSEPSPRGVRRWGAWPRIRSLPTTRGALPCPCPLSSPGATTCSRRVLRHQCARPRGKHRCRAAAPPARAVKPRHRALRGKDPSRPAPALSFPAPPRIDARRCWGQERRGGGAAGPRPRRVELPRGDHEAGAPRTAGTGPTARRATPGAAAAADAAAGRRFGSGAVSRPRFRCGRKPNSRAGRRGAA